MPRISTSRVPGRQQKRRVGVSAVSAFPALSAFPPFPALFQIRGRLAASYLSGYSMAGMAESFLIVDGHSIIFAWPELLTLQRRSGAGARDDLIKMLTEYQDLSGIHVVVVFDGKGDRVNEVTEPGGIQVFYSNAGRTADEIVERLVAKYGHKYAITVATGDLLEQQTVISFGAQCVGSEGLRRRIEDAKTEFATELKRRRKAAK
jgi:predicted RNA-binding protein with PIN domain